MSSDPNHYGNRWNDGDDGTARFGHSRHAWPRKSAAEIGCEIPPAPAAAQPQPMPEDWEPTPTEADREADRREQAEAVNTDSIWWRPSRG